MQQDLRKSEAYQWICRDFSQVLDAQEIGADRVKNRSIDLTASSELKCFRNSTLWLHALRLESAITSTIAQFRF